MSTEIKFHVGHLELQIQFVVCFVVLASVWFEGKNETIMFIETK